MVMDHGSLSELGGGSGCQEYTVWKPRKEGPAARGEDATLTIDGAIAAAKLVDRV